MRVTNKVGMGCCQTHAQNVRYFSRNYKVYPIERTPQPLQSELPLTRPGNPYQEYSVERCLRSCNEYELFSALHVFTYQPRLIKRLSKFSSELNPFQELELSRSFSHCNLVQLCEAFEDDISLYLVYQYCAGPSLRHCLDTGRQFTEGEARVIMKQLFAAVEHAHSKSIALKIVSPEYILFQNGNDLRIVLSTFRIDDEASPDLCSVVEAANGFQELKRNVLSCGLVLFLLFSGVTVQSDLMWQVARFRQHPIMPGISSPALLLLAELLQPNYQYRISARVALTFHWLAVRGNQVLKPQAECKLAFRDYLSEFQWQFRHHLAHCSKASNDISSLRQTFRELNKEVVDYAVGVDLLKAWGSSRELLDWLEHAVKNQSSAKITFSQFVTMSIDFQLPQTQDLLAQCIARHTGNFGEPFSPCIVKTIVEGDFPLTKETWDNMLIELGVGPTEAITVAELVKVLRKGA